MRQKFDLPLVNAHTHAAMVAFRGMAEDLHLEEWLNDYIWPAERQRVSSTFIDEQTKKAILEMQKNGIKLFSDMYFFEERVAEVAEEMGMHVVLGEGLLDFPTPGAKTPAEALEKTEKLLIKYRSNPLVKVAVAAHSIYTVSQENLVKANNLAEKYQTIFHIHLAETKKEFDECLTKNKLTPVAYLDKLGILNERAVLAHCVWVTDADIKILAERKANVVHCPLGNLKLGSGVAPVTKMLDSGINICLGTDGAASSNRLDIWEAGKMAALIQKGVNLDSSCLPTREVVKMMTVNGLRALGFTTWDGKSLKDLEKEIAKNNYNFLYELNTSEIDF